jgi:ABC-2 type transport system ATP-binding protein
MKRNEAKKSMIVARELTKYYGLKQAIQEVSFQINRGEVVGFLGPNGAGKTTILRIMTCFMQPTSGTMMVDDMDCRAHSLEVRKRRGFLPESVPLYTELSVRSFLSFAGTIKGLSGKKIASEVDRATSLCGLSEHRGRLIKYLSKGLKQRVGIAQALLNNPPILILDEPTTGLDPAQIVEVRNIIKELGGQRTVLLSTHVLPEVSHLCQRVIIVNQGRVIAEDTPKNLTDKLQKGLRTMLLVDGPQDQIKAKLASIEGISKVETFQREGEFVVESTPEENIRPLLAKAVVEAGWRLKEMKALDLSLEEVFVHLVTEEGKEAQP